MSVYQQPAEPPAAPLAAGPAPAIDGAREKSSAFPPAWVKTPQDFDDWLYGEVKRTLENPGPSYSHEEAVARIEKNREDFLREKERRDAARA